MPGGMSTGAIRGTNMDKKKKYSKPKRKEGYLHKSPAICVVVHDMHGNPMPDAVAAQILNAVTDIAINNNYLVSFTRT